MDDNKRISINNLDGGYIDNKVLRNLTIDFSKGKFIAIAGPNGAGKSTVLKYLINELIAENNVILINSKDITSYKQIDLAKEISMVSQFSKTDYEFTIRELVAMGRYCHQDEASNTKEVDNALETVEIKYLENRLISTLSGGEFQLSMLARAICQDTPVLALDEPVNNLDPAHELKLLNLLKKLSTEGKTIICVLHDLNAILNFCDECVLINKGSVFCYGKPYEVLTPEKIKKVYGIDSKLLTLGDDRRLLTFYCNR